MIDQSTICAISTPPGVGGIAVIRLSGSEAITITERAFSSPNGKKKLAEQSANTLHFGAIRSGEKMIDEVVVSLFRAPHSFTGEDVVEISCHGSQYIQQAILELLLSKGARMAGPGEFTQRAFLNGKMDLSQAEAVADLIASTSAASHKLALNQMRGGFSQELTKLRGELLSFVSLIELELDFSEEDVEFADRTQLLDLATRIEAMIGKLADSFKLGNVIKNGIPVTIAGETNVGKSTLLNALLNDERAIVSEIAGTTRDTIEDVINIRGVSFRFIDTAGIRTTADKIESMGIERTYQKIKQASIVLLLLDLTREPEKYLKNLEDVREHIDKQNLIIVGNKADQVDESVVRKMLMDITLADNEDMVFISAKMGHNIDSLKSLLLETVNLAKLNNEEDVIVTNARHFEALTQAREAINRAIDGLHNSITGDFLSQDIRECMHHLGLITGEISTDEVLANIFKNFCIGK
jgi:tRNA modification GTPase